MKKILVVDDVNEITELVVMILETELEGYEFFEFSSGNQAINYLKKSHAGVELVICDHNMPDGTGSDVYSFIQENNPSIPFIHMSTGSHLEFERLKTLLEDHSGNACMFKPFDEEILMATVTNSLKESVENIPSNFTKLKISSVSEYINEFFKVYIEVDKKPILLFDDSDSSDSKKLEELSSKGLDTILIETSEYNDWIKTKIKQINSVIGECSFNNPTSLKELTDTLFRHSTFVMNIANPKILNIEKMNNSTNQVLSTFWEKPELKKEVIDLFTKLGYRSGHSAICLVLTWLYTKTIERADINLFSKLTHASLLHDISLDEDELSVLITKEDIENSSYSSREKEYILQHPIISAEKLEQWDVIDSDVLRIIKEHHELPDATGYPKSLSKSNAHKLSTAFQFILQLAHRIYMNKGKLDTSLESMSKTFSLNDYEPLINSLRRL